MDILYFSQKMATWRPNFPHPRLWSCPFAKMTLKNGVSLILPSNIQKGFLKSCEGFLRYSNLSSQIGTWTELDRAWDIFWIKSNNGTFIAPQLKSFGRKKVPFWQLFRKGQDGCVLIVRPSRIPHRISKILFVLDSHEFLVMLEGKIRETPFFQGAIW